jgi:hypothetical protein
MALVTDRQWKTPGDLLTSYRNLEKLTGVPAEQIVRIPQGENADWNPVYDRLGRPKEAKDYSLPLPEGDKGEFATVASAWFHEAGLSRRQAVAVAEKWNAFAAQQGKAQGDATAARDVEQTAQLKKDWGADFDKHSTLVDQAAKEFGMTPEQLTALKAVMGPAAAMKFVHNIGTKIGTEGDFVTNSMKPGANGQYTPEQAQAKIVSLRADKQWVKRFADGDSDTRAEMRNLHKQAYPGDTVI